MWVKTNSPSTLAQLNYLFHNMKKKKSHQNFLMRIKIVIASLSNLTPLETKGRVDSTLLSCVALFFSIRYGEKKKKTTKKDLLLKESLLR